MGMFLVTFGFTIASVRAVTVVSWGGDYVSANQVFVNTTTTSPNSYRTYTSAGQSYSTLTNSLQNLTPDAGYSGPIGKTVNFSGGFMGSAGTSAAVPGGAGGTTSAINSRAVLDNGTNDRINISLQTTNPQIRGAITFAKSDFLGGMSLETVGFDSSSTLSFSGIMGGVRPVGRWLVQDGSVWYISLASITQSASNVVETHTLSDLNNMQWAVYVPTLTDTAGTYFINEAPLSGYDAHIFENVQSIGLYFDSYGQPASADGSSYSRFTLQSFSASAVAVPEPSLAALIVFGLGVITLARYRVSER